jgi:large subunit ribosomal protein L1
MGKNGKRFAAVAEKIDREQLMAFSDAIGLLKETATAKFDEAAEAIFRLGIDPKKNEHRVRGTVSLPNGTGRTVRVIVIAKGEAMKQAEDAGADRVGGEDLIEEISGGWLEFDKLVATPDMMSVVSQLGKVLGPRGLMPSPKSGTVTNDVGQAVTELKGGKVEFRVDEYGQIQSPFGRASFDQEKLVENFLALASAIFDEKPDDTKGRFLQNCGVASTMGPGIKIDPEEVTKAVTEGKL